MKKIKAAEKSIDTEEIPFKEESIRQHHELQILFDISSAIHSSPHLKDVLQRTLGAILKTLKFKMGAIYLVREVVDDRWIFDLAAHQGFSEPLVKAIQAFSMQSERVNRFYSYRPVRWFPRNKIVFSRLRQRMKEEGVQEIICISLMNKKKVLGLLYVSNEGELQLQQDRSEFLTTIGSQLGVAIENAKLFESVERAKTELEISFDAMQHSILLVDTRWRIYRINRTTQDIYGAGGQQLIGRKYTEVLYGTQAPHPDCPVLACLRQERPIHREGPHPRWGGHYRYHAYPVFNPTGSLERVVYYEKDVTESRKLEQRLQLSERLKALGTLAAGIAHEIRNPLATINFNTQMLQREMKLDDSQLQMFDDIVAEIKKIDRIVQQVLHFARPKDPQFLPNQMNDVVRYCHDLAKVYLRKAEVEVVIDLADDVPLHVMDFNQVAQVVMNIVINAIEAMSKGGRLTLRTEFDRDLDAVILEVSDTGPGIRREDLDQIFDPFFTRKPEGTGLGLSISRQILENHGAYIEVETDPATGTTFRLIFPLTPGAKPDGKKPRMVDVGPPEVFT